MRTLIIIFFVIIPKIIFCQNTIVGSVFNQNKEQLSFATVEFLSVTDSTLIKVVTSDSAAIFSTQIQNLNCFQIRVSYIGYKPFLKKIVIDSLVKDYNIGEVVLEASDNNLKEIIITNDKKIIEKKIDRLVFNVENTIISGDALELLSKTPMVQVSGSNISVIGKGSVRVLFNDKLFYLSDEDLINFLKSIPSENISKIEVITTPPAKYDAIGGALINIITKKTTLLGTSGSINTSYTQAFYPTGQLGLNLNHRRSKINIFGNSSFTKGSIRPVEETKNSYVNRSFFQTEYTNRNNTSLNNNLGIDCELNKKNTIGLLYNSSIYNVNTNSTSHADYINFDSSIDSIMSAETKYYKNSNTHAVNLNYSYRIDSTNKKINIDADLVRFHNKKERTLNGMTFSNPLYFNTSNISRYTNSNQLINIGTFKIDVEWPNKIIDVDYGVKFNWINNNSDNNIYSIQSGIQVLDSLQSNKYRYDEKTQAAYLNFYKSIKKIEFQIGLRLENTILNGYTPFESKKINVVNRTYLNLFPTLYLMYNINENNYISITYDRRIDRPEYNALSPFRYYQTPYIYSEGNPFLRPNFPNNIDLSYAYNQNYILGLIYTGMRDSYTEVPTQINESTLAYLQKNVGNTDQFGAYCVVPFNLFKIVENSLMITYVSSHYKTSLQNYSDVNQNVFVCDFNSNVSFGKNNRFSAELNSHMFPFGSVYAISKMGEQYIVNLGIKMSVLKNKGFIRIGFNDIFRQSTPTSISSSNEVNVYLNNQYDTRNFRVGFTYKFGNNTLKASRNRRTGSEEESNRLRK